MASEVTQRLMKLADEYEKAFPDLDADDLRSMANEVASSERQARLDEAKWWQANGNLNGDEARERIASLEGQAAQKGAKT